MSSLLSEPSDVTIWGGGLHFSPPRHEGPNWRFFQNESQDADAGTRLCQQYLTDPLRGRGPVTGEASLPGGQEPLPPPARRERAAARGLTAGAARAPLWGAASRLSEHPGPPAEGRRTAAAAAGHSAHSWGGSGGRPPGSALRHGRPAPQRGGAEPGRGRSAPAALAKDGAAAAERRCPPPDARAGAAAVAAR